MIKIYCFIYPNLSYLSKISSHFTKKKTLHKYVNSSSEVIAQIPPSILLRLSEHVNGHLMDRALKSVK